MVRPTSRRDVLVATTVAGLATVAGCLGNGNGDDDDDNGEDFDRPDDWPDNEAFTPNPDAEGPGGDVTIAMDFTLREDYAEVDEFEAFEVEFDAVTLHKQGGDEVEVPVDRTVDFYDFDVGEDIVLIFAAEIPDATYDEMSFDMSGSEIIHEDDGDVTDSFSAPDPATFGVGDPWETDADQYLLSANQIWVSNPPELTIRNVGLFSGPGDMTDPAYFD